MPKGDRAIFKADTDDGFTRIANLILEALSMVRINSTQTGICLFLLRRTYGWNRSQDAVPLGDFAAACGTSKTYVSRQLADLLHKKIILRLAYEPGKTPVYAFCTNVAECDGACIDLQALAYNDREGLYECAPEDCSDKAKETGWGLSDQISYGLSNRITPGLSDKTTRNQTEKQAGPEPTAGLKTERKTIKEREVYAPDSLPYQLAELLLKKIIEHLPGYKPPDLQKWAKTMEAILRLDKRPPDEVKQVIIFAQADQFWRANILSADKLRKHYDRLNIRRMERAGPSTAKYNRRQGSGCRDNNEYERFFR